MATIPKSAAACYRTLGVSPGATWEEIRRRYRALALKYHPDRNADPRAAGRFRRVTEAYEALKADREHRRRAEAFASAQKYRAPRFSQKRQIFEDLFGIAGNGGLMSASPGADFRYDLQIPFAGAIRGMATIIKLHRTLDCGFCGGSGRTPGTGYCACPDCQGRGRRFGGPGLLRFGPVCPRCEGRGRVAAVPCGHCHGLGCRGEERHYQVEIPPGAADGDRLCLAGEGGAGFRNGPAGDLQVVIHVQPHEFFTRLGNDLYCRVRISLTQAAHGGPVRIPTLDGYRTLHLPRGTRTGRIFRFLGAGAPGGNGHPPGDQVMEVVVAAPESLSPNYRPIFQPAPFDRGASRAAHE